MKVALKPITLLCYGLFLLGVVLCLVQMWFAPWSPDLFVKLLFTVGAFFLITFVWAFLIKEKRASDEINKGHGLD